MNAMKTISFIAVLSLLAGCAHNGPVCEVVGERHVWNPDGGVTITEYKCPNPEK